MNFKGYTKDPAWFKKRLKLSGKTEDLRKEFRRKYGNNYERVILDYYKNNDKYRHVDVSIDGGINYTTKSGFQLTGDVESFFNDHKDLRQ